MESSNNHTVIELIECSKCQKLFDWKTNVTDTIYFGEMTFFFHKECIETMKPKEIIKLCDKLRNQIIAEVVDDLFYN